MKKMNNEFIVTRFGLNLNTDPDDIDFYLSNSSHTRHASYKILRDLRNSSLELADKIEALIQALRELGFHSTIRNQGLEQLAQEARNQANQGEFSCPSHRGRNSKSLTHP